MRRTAGDSYSSTVGNRTSSTPSVWSRGVIAAIAVVVVLLPIIGLKVFGNDPEAVQPTGTVTLTSGNRLIFLTGQHLASMPLTGNAAPTIADVECARVDATSGRGLCLRKSSAVAWAATLLDRTLAPQGAYPVDGTPSLARLSPSGRMAAWTSFVTGSSYSHGRFSTQTTVLDTKGGALFYPVDFAATVEGKPVKSKASERQVWGVTFADDNRFYATLLADGERYLVAGDLGRRTLRAIARNVALPSLSPDGTRIAFLHAIDGDPHNGWRLSVLRLGGRRVVATADGRNVEDQAIWLNDRTLGYTVRSDDGSPSIWTVPADGTGRPSLLRDNAESPAVL
jgi:hypothetical protein